MASIEMTSPAHQAALGFLRGGLIAAVSLMLNPAIGAVLAGVFHSGWPAELLRCGLPLAGFAFGGAVGGEALGVGSRGATGFACGGAAAALVLLVTAPHLQGLTGFEDPLVVVSYAVGTSALAFGASGLVGSLVVRRGKVGRVSAVFAGGGAIGGLLWALPLLALPWTGPMWADLSMFATMACSIGSVVVPLMVGGSSAARNWS
jgi:hypothetical protein